MRRRRRPTTATSEKSHRAPCGRHYASPISIARARFASCDWRASISAARFRRFDRRKSVERSHAAQRCGLPTYNAADLRRLYTAAAFIERARTRSRTTKMFRSAAVTCSLARAPARAVARMSHERVLLADERALATFFIWSAGQQALFAHAARARRASARVCARLNA